MDSIRTSRAPRIARVGLAAAAGLWLVAWLFALGQELRGGIPNLPFVVEPAISAEAYPTVASMAFLPEDALQPTEIPLAGEPILEIGGRDLRGTGRLEAALALAGRADEQRRVSVRYMRDGGPRQTRIELPRQPRMWRNLLGAVLVVVVGLMAVWRAPELPAARAFAWACLGWAFHITFFWGRSELQTGLAIASSSAGAFLFFPMALRTVLLFPPSLARFDLPSRLLPWLAAPTALGFTIHNFGILAPHGWGLPLALGGNGILAMAVLVGLGGRYRRAPEEGRRQLRWVGLGCYLVIVPQLFTSLAALWDPRWLPVQDAAWTLNLLLPLFILVALVRHHLFDIDRLVTRAATYSVLGIALFGGLFALVPWAASHLESWTSLPHESSQLVLAALMAGVLFPAQNALRPRIEGWFFPERQRLEHAFDGLADELSNKDDPIDLLRLLLHGLARELELERAAAYLLIDAEGALIASVGAPPSAGLEEESVALVARRNRAIGHLQARQALAPVRRAGELIAVLWLGPKRSGDVYSAGDLAHVTALAGRASAELLRVHDEEILTAVQASAAELRAQKEAAERNMEERSRQLAGASHDLRQPLHALGLLVDGLAERAEDPATLETVRRIAASSQALEEMFTGLLDLSRLEADEGAAEIGPVALAPLLDRLEAELSPVAAAKDLCLVVHPRAWFVRSEPVMLRRILSNLMHNAIRYTERGRVVVTVRPDGEQARIDVRDSGSGIPPEEQTRIFEAFHRAPGTRSQAEGLGLGLAVAQGLADQLGHRIALRSELGEGSVFSVIAPRMQPADVPAPTASPLDGLRFAVLDLPAAERSALEGRLEGWGCVSAELGDADIWLIGYKTRSDGIQRLRELTHGTPPTEASKPVILLMADEPEARPAGPDSPVYGLARDASPARLRALLTHLNQRRTSSSRERN